MSHDHPRDQGQIAHNTHRTNLLLEQGNGLLAEISRKVEKLATAEQITALNNAIDELEASTTTEIGQINARIDELVAAAGGTADPALDAAVARLQAQRDRIAGIIPDAAPPAEG